MFKRLFCWVYFRGKLSSEGLIIGRNFAFQNGLSLTLKTPRKQRKTANSRWACIREGLLEGYLRLRFEGFIFGKAFFLGRAGGSYYRSFTVSLLHLPSRGVLPLYKLYVFCPLQTWKKFLGP